MLKTEWLFFDIGSTLVDESEAYHHRIREMIEGSEITFEQFCEMRIRFAKKGLDGDAAAAAWFHLKKTPWHSEDEMPYRDTESALSALKARGYQMGVIANQAPGADSRLERWGLLKFFDVVATSAEMGAAKPDREIFLRALNRANCRPEHAYMIGDRLDNDIAPAKALGMTTIWMMRGLAAYQSPKNEAETPDFSVGSLSDLLKLLP